MLFRTMLLHYDSKYVTDLFTREIFTTGHNLVNKVCEYDVRFGQLAAIVAYTAHLKAKSIELAPKIF